MKNAPQLYLLFRVSNPLAAC